LPANLFLQTWNRLDSEELKLLLFEEIGGSGQYHEDLAENSPFYLPLAGDECQIVLKFKEKKIVSIESGSAFEPTKWAKIITLVDNLINGGQKKVGRQISFSTRRVDGYWSGTDSNIQICPPPECAPMPNYLYAENPFVLEFPFVQSGNIMIDNYRLEREHRRYSRVLNAILSNHIQFHGMRRRDFWAQLNTNDGTSESVQYRWVPNSYFADIGASVCDALTLHSEQLAKVFSSSEYYLPQTFRGDYLTVPDNLDQLLSIYQNLLVRDREDFDQAAYWFDLAARQWEISASASFVSLVSAIETFVGRGSVHTIKCPECNEFFDHEVPGATRRFKEFLKTHAGEPEFKKQRDKMYNIRSKIAHGSDLLILDREYYSGWDPVSQSELQMQWQLQSVTKAAMISWLRSKSTA
jgi:hypothetical protein